MDNDRKLIANELLPIYQTTDQGEKVVDGRELHEFLQAGRDFTTWLKDRIDKYGFNEGEDYSPVSGNIPEGRGKPRTDYVLKLDMAKELAMVENNEQGRQARKYFIEVERRFRNGAIHTTPVHDYPPFPEHDQITKLLQMLRLGLREHLFTDATEHALRTQVAEMVLGHSILGAEPSPEVVQPYVARPDVWLQPKRRETFGLQAGVPVHERWYLTAEIASLAGVSTQMVASMSSQHNMRTPDKSRMAKTNPGKLSGLVQIMYNEQAKDELLKLLAVHSERARRKTRR